MQLNVWNDLAKPRGVGRKNSTISFSCLLGHSIIATYAYLAAFFVLEFRFNTRFRNIQPQIRRLEGKSTSYESGDNLLFGYLNGD